MRRGREAIRAGAASPVAVTAGGPPLPRRTSSPASPTRSDREPPLHSAGARSRTTAAVCWSAIAGIRLPPPVTTSDEGIDSQRGSVSILRRRRAEQKRRSEKNDRDRKLKVAGRRLKEAPPSGRTKVTAATPAVFRRHSAPPSLCRREDAAEPTGLVLPPPRLTAAADDRRKTE
nr:hypothetical protein Iba_scaffold17528.3CG0180 [Ipomoea batatas]